MKNHLTFSTIVIILAFVIGASVSCKKDDDSDPSKTDQLTGKNFRVTAMVINPAVVVEGIEFSDFYAFMDACTKDDITVFKTDGTVTFDEGATKCDAGDPQTTSGTWEFQDNETKLKVVSDGETEIFNIIELTSSKLKISYDIVEDFGNGEETYTYTITFNAN